MSRPKVGVSRCLLGDPVRYAGDHRREPYVADELAREFEWVPVCPEVEAGFGVPRETLRLEGDRLAPRLVTTETRADRTEAMQAWVGARLAGLPADLCGFILKRGSPSCGPLGVKLYAQGSAEPQPVARGLFARALLDADPDLPLADEEMLRDPQFARMFVERIRQRYRERER